jgi:hypothetical protein
MTTFDPTVLGDEFVVEETRLKLVLLTSTTVANLRKSYNRLEVYLPHAAYARDRDSTTRTVTGWLDEHIRDVGWHGIEMGHPSCAPAITPIPCIS